MAVKSGFEHPELVGEIHHLPRHLHHTMFLPLCSVRILSNTISGKRDWDSCVNIMMAR
jgi:hypothetical protein